MSFFWGHWYPCFGFLVTSPLGFKARVGSALFAIFAEANVMYIPQDSPLVLHLPTSWRPACSRSLPHMHVQRWDLAQIRTCNRTNRRRTRYHCASDPAYVPLTWLVFWSTNFETLKLTLYSTEVVIHSLKGFIQSYSMQKILFNKSIYLMCRKFKFNTSKIIVNHFSSCVGVSLGELQITMLACGHSGTKDFVRHPLPYWTFALYNKHDLYIIYI